MKQSKLVLMLMLLSAMCVSLQARVGDPGVTFDASKYDSDYPEMREWQKAGVQGGIPWLSSTPVKKTIGATNSDGLNAAINQVHNNGGGQLKLNNGTYTINKRIEVKSNVRIVGQSRTGVKLNVTMTGEGYAIEFVGTKAGIENLTIQGGYGTPNNFDMTDAKPNFLITMVNFPRAAQNCWLDKVNIYNSGSSAIASWDSKHITIRDCDIQRSWNKGGGGHGYVGIQGSYFLITGTHVKYMRHISIQKQYAKYNVLYNNNFEQEVSFHVGDAGYNLVEKNTITLASGLDDGWHAIMTPWSYRHEGPGPKNAVYKNTCRENNNGGIVSFSDPNIVYVPKAHYQVFDENRNTPRGGTFYPINVSGSSSSSSGGSCNPTAITPYLKVGSGSWQQTSNVTINAGQQIWFGPHPTTGGSWRWSGCGVSSSEAVERDPKVTINSSCSITATYTNSCGAVSTKTFNITVNGSSSSSSSSSGGTTFVQMRKRNASSYAMDGGNGGANGQNVYIWSFNSSNVNQQWEEINRGSGYYSYKKINTNYCLDGGNGGANGQNVYLWTCNSTNQNQQWKKVDAGSGNYRLEKRNASGYSIDGGNGGSNGQNLYLWSSNHSNQNQHWTFITGTKSTHEKPVSNAAESAPSIYPNPFADKLTINLNGVSYKELRIYNAMGRLIAQEDLEWVSEKVLNMGDYSMPAGVYLVQLLDTNMQYTAYKVMRD